MNQNKTALAFCSANNTGKIFSIHVMKAYGEVYMYLHSSLNSPLNVAFARSETHAAAILPPGTHLVPNEETAGLDPGPVWTSSRT
jgi:hypothetical protein